MRALVTGAAVRLGRAIALGLAQDGFDIAVHCNRSRAEAAELVGRLGPGSTVVQGDLSTESGCRAVVEAVGEWGAIDVLVNSAAAYESVPFADLDAARWDAMQALNTRAPFLLTRGFLPALARSGRPGGGCVVNLADIGGERPAPGFTHYSVSKAGLIMMTRALALELAPAVRVNAVAPGLVLPPEALDPAVREAILATVPLRREGTAQDVAGAVRYLVAAPYVTGVVLAVDGGRSVGGPMEAG